MTPRLRRAHPGDASRLTELALASKAHWGYPEDWLAAWRRDLTFDREMILRDWVYVAEAGGCTVGVAAVGGEPQQPELTHLWVDPPVIGGGVGRLLFEAAAREARRSGAGSLEIVSDPNAVGFYETLGARLVGHVDSRPGGRRLPLLILDLSRNDC